MQVRGYLTSPAPPSREDGEAPGRQQIADDLYRALRGQDNLIFANARAEVELSRSGCATSASGGSPERVLPHHGSLSRELREDVEAGLKKDAPATSSVPGRWRWGSISER